ncbi:MAG TPA: amidohydrolase [Gammaproteobacteria bacterium]|nr:amidohydrolase [Gammaproteobacteria bacterium]
MPPSCVRAACRASILVLGCWAFSQAAVADVLIHDVRGYTWTQDGPERFEALRFSPAGRVVAIGDAAVIAGDGAIERVDGQGRTMLPGFIDAHAHLLNLGHAARQVDLTGATSLDEALGRVAEFAAAHPDTPWLLGRGWNQELWAGREWPRASDLDGVPGGRPALLTRVDGHAAWANSRAMSLAGIDAGTTAPAGGEILRTASGAPSGVFIDAAIDLVERHIPPPTPAEDEAALLLALDEAASVGLTSVHDAGVSAAHIALYRRLADQGRLKLRIYAMLSGSEALGAFEAPATYGDGRLLVRSVKLYADGALGSRGAALLAAYSDSPGTRGLLFEDDATLRRLIETVNGRGFQASVHAIGDAANRQVLDAFEAVQGARPSPLRNRIEHAQVVRVADLERFRTLGVVASMQFTHATSDMNMAEARVGAARMRGAYAWRSFVDQQTVLAAGSDFPVEDPNPFYGLHAAVTRRDRSGEPAGGWYPAQALTLDEALRAFTLDAAWAAHQERELGSLEAGKWADFVLVDRDPFKIPAQTLWQVKVLETWVAGERVYTAARTSAVRDR